MPLAQIGQRQFFLLQAMMQRKLRLLFVLTFSLIITQYGLSSDNVTSAQIADIQNPGMIKLEGLVKQVSVSDTICDRAYSSSIILEIYKVNSVGRGLTNRLSVGQNVTLVVDSIMEKVLNNQKNVPSEGQRISIKAKEKICQELYQSAYQIITLERI